MIRTQRAIVLKFFSFYCPQTGKLFHLQNSQTLSKPAISWILSKHKNSSNEWKYFWILCPFSWLLKEIMLNVMVSLKPSLGIEMPVFCWSRQNHQGLMSSSVFWLFYQKSCVVLLSLVTLSLQMCWVLQYRHAGGAFIWSYFQGICLQLRFLLLICFLIICRL